ncbi:MAG: thioredoxin family protein [Beijerinckiaceae bacterium]|nr:thioredoxin family protein [Beijerinckiaceae bacterium]
MSSRTGFLARVGAVLCAALFWMAPPMARAGELVFVDRAGCPYCAKWEREVAPVYSKTPEGRRAPLRKVSLDDGQPAGAASPVRFTPTFLLMEEGREIGRITGYIDQAMFWGMLTKFMERLEPERADAAKG